MVLSEDPNDISSSSTLKLVRTTFYSRDLQSFIACFKLANQVNLSIPGILDCRRKKTKENNFFAYIAITKYSDRILVSGHVDFDKSKDNDEIR
jgi:hypothetical protein